MRRIVWFSGGLSSFEVARRLVSDFGKDAIECVFADTKTEDEDLYRFIDHAIAFLGCRLVRLCDGRDIWQVFNDERFMGNSRIDPCSKLLKREISARYLRDSGAEPSNCVLYYGITAHECHRLDALVRRWAPFVVEVPLVAAGVTKEHILWELDRAGIVPPRLYDLGFEHNNCGGFCVKTGQRQMRLLLQTFPDRYRWHEQQQEALFARIGPHGFIRQVTGGVTAYLSLKEFRESVERNEPLQLFNDGACACFS